LNRNCRNWLDLAPIGLELFGKAGADTKACRSHRAAIPGWPSALFDRRRLAADSEGFRVLARGGDFGMSVSAAELDDSSPQSLAETQPRRRANCDLGGRQRQIEQRGAWNNMEDVAGWPVLLLPSNAQPIVGNQSVLDVGKRRFKPKPLAVLQRIVAGLNHGDCFIELAAVHGDAEGRDIGHHGSTLRIAGLKTCDAAVALADVAAAIERPVQDLVRRHDNKAVRARSHTSTPPAVITNVGRRRSAITGGIVGRLGAAAGAADVGPLSALVDIVARGVPVAMVAALP